MQQRRYVWIGLSVLIAGALGWTLALNRENRKSSEQVIRTYVVPQDRTDEVRNTLNRLLGASETGSAQLFGGGLLLVRAPETFQAGIGKMVSMISEMKASPRGTIRMDYWVVTGQADAKSNAAAFPQIESVLSAIVNVDGARKFRMLEHLSSNALMNSEVQTEGYMLKTTSVAWTKGDVVQMKINLKSRFGEIKTDTEMKPGEFIILGQNAVDPTLKAANMQLGAPDTNVYYIVRTEAGR